LFANGGHPRQQLLSVHEIQDAIALDAGYHRGRKANFNESQLRGAVGISA
jgi:hypothetical protein